MAIKKYSGKTKTSWIVTIDLPRDPLTNRHRHTRKSFDTKREAEQWEREQRVQIDKGIYVEPSTMPLATYLHDWHDKAGGRESTGRSRKLTIDTHITPDPIGGLELGQLRRAHVHDWVDRLAIRLAPGTVRKVFVQLRKAIRRAHRLGMIPIDPSDGIELPANPRKPKHTLTNEQVTTLIEGTRDDNLHAAWLLMAVVGLRVGECIALKWDDVDLDRGILHVRRTQTIGADGKRHIGDAPKTDSSRRDIILPAMAVEALKQQRTRQLERRLAASTWEDTGAVFDSGHGRHYADPTTWTRQLIRRCTRLGLPDTLTPHSLRHSAASNALRGGVPITTVSKMLGHADPAITLREYAHVLVGMEAEAAERLDALYRRMA